MGTLTPCRARFVTIGAARFVITVLGPVTHDLATVTPCLSWEAVP